MSLKQRDWVGWVLKNAELYISMKEKQRIILPTNFPYKFYRNFLSCYKNKISLRVKFD